MIIVGVAGRSQNLRADPALDVFLTARIDTGVRRNHTALIMPQFRLLIESPEIRLTAKALIAASPA
jgi:hypothetical protein